MKLLKTLAIAAASAAVAVTANAEGLLGKNFVAAGAGTTIFDEGLFDSREYSTDAAASLNYNVAPNGDINLALGYSRVSGNMGGGSVRVQATSAMLRGVLFGNATPGIRPFVSAGFGIVDFRMRDPVGRFSDNTFAIALGTGVEFQMMEATALRLSTEWTNTGKLSDGGFEIPQDQDISIGSLLSHHFTEEVFGFVSLAFDNEWNDTSFLVGAGWQF